MPPFPDDRSEWKSYGNYTRICWGKIFVHPVRPWWWLLELYTILILCIFAMEFEKFATWQIAIGLSTGALFLVSSFKTILADPGICPRPSYEDAMENYNQIQQDPTFYRKKIVFTKEKAVEHSYCYRCNMYRPPTAGHCGICDCCILGWDHHCPVFGGCVGYKNKGWFYAMVFSLPVYSAFLLGVSAITVATAESTSPWYENMTLCCALLGYLGAIVLPTIMGCCSCWDKVHSSKSSGARSLQPQPTTFSNSNATYPRQPPAPNMMTISKLVQDEDESNGNDKDVTINFTTY